METAITKEEHRQNKARLITSVVLQSVSIIRKAAITAYPRKRMFGKHDRRPLVRIGKAQAKVTLATEPYSMGIQVAIIAAQPIPRFKKGTHAEAQAHILPEAVYRGDNIVYASGQNKN